MPGYYIFPTTLGNLLLKDVVFSIRFLYPAWMLHSFCVFSVCFSLNLPLYIWLILPHPSPILEENIKWDIVQKSTSGIFFNFGSDFRPEVEERKD